MSDCTISTASYSDASARSATMTSAELVLLLECERPLAGSSRHRLASTDEAIIGRGDKRRVERSGATMLLRVPDGRISTAHAAIRPDGLAYVIADERSKNGLMVNGVRVERHLLRDRDVIECGRTFFMFRAAQPHARVARRGWAPSGCRRHVAGDLS